MGELKEVYGLSRWNRETSPEVATLMTSLLLNPEGLLLKVKCSLDSTLVLKNQDLGCVSETETLATAMARSRMSSYFSALADAHVHVAVAEVTVSDTA